MEEIKRLINKKPLNSMKKQGGKPKDGIQSPSPRKYTIKEL